MMGEDSATHARETGLGPRTHVRPGYFEGKVSNGVETGNAQTLPQRRYVTARSAWNGFRLLKSNKVGVLGTGTLL